MAKEEVSCNLSTRVFSKIWTYLHLLRIRIFREVDFFFDRQIARRSSLGHVVLKDACIMNTREQFLLTIALFPVSDSNYSLYV